MNTRRGHQIKNHVFQAPHFLNLNLPIVHVHLPAGIRNLFHVSIWNHLEGIWLSLWIGLLISDQSGCVMVQTQEICRACLKTQNDLLKILISFWITAVSVWRNSFSNSFLVQHLLSTLGAQHGGKSLFAHFIKSHGSPPIHVEGETEGWI